MKNFKKPLVSVCCITYNHEKYLAQAINSVLMQKTDFEIEIIIGEDLSVDSTRNIAKDIASRHSNINLLPSEKNLGIMPNLMRTLLACQGEYIAFLEGDDYWISENKLQIQVNMLEKNADCNLCFHDAEVEYGNVVNKYDKFSSKYAKGILDNVHAVRKLSQYELLKAGWIVPSASMMFRKSSLNLPLPEWSKFVFGGDITLQLISTRYSKALYIPEMLSCYRLHEGGITSVKKDSAWMLDKQLWEGKYWRKIVEKELIHRVDIYLAMKYQGYAYYWFQRKKYVKYATNYVKYFYYMGKAIPGHLYFKYILNI